ncbi:MAG TPA: phosphatidate cytidylyltransferase [Burkholderiaceae bacterium]|nr:phosphatidate cytidylyltransferase [Burkholderiaceae bacterium]
MLRTRVLTAIVLLLALTAAAAISLQALIAFGAAFVGVTLFEWLRLSGVAARYALPASVLSALAGFFLQLENLGPSADVLAVFCAVSCTVWLCIGILLVRAQRKSLPLKRPLLVVGALLLGGTAWFALVDLLHRGILWTLSVLALVWIADIAAYFFGRSFGVRKLASRISPGKTWAGVWGAVLSVSVIAEAVRWLWPQAPLWSTRLLIAAPVYGIGVLLAFVALSIVGDLFESLVKRQAGAKDSGKILPGHGGVWDRIDATLPTLPLAVLSQWTVVNGWNHG